MIMNVGDVMGRVAIAVELDTSFADLVETMRRFKVGAVAVVDPERRPVGVVSAPDLLLKEIGAPHGGVLESRRRRGERAKASGNTAARIMTAPAITVTEATPVREAARVMHDERVRQLPVVDAVTGKIVGTVHQSDLLKIFARPPADVRSDVESAIRAAGVVPGSLAVLVDHGLVSLRGTVPRRSQAKRLVEGVHAIDGVIEVDDRLAYETDDLLTVPPLYI